MCYVEPLNAKNDLNKNGPFYQHILTRVINYYLKDLSHFEKSNPAYSFISNITWKIFFIFRSFFQSYNVIELSEFEETKEPEGVMINVSSRSKEHDLLIIYVPNVPLFGSEPFFYIEYLMTLHSLLLLQGFDSPAIFIMKFPEICKESSMEYNLKILVETIDKIIQNSPNSKIVLMGDSMGATLILSFLSIENNIFYDQNISTINNDSNLNINPFATVLISPIVKLKNLETKENDHCQDYLNNKIITEYASFYCNNKITDKYNPITWDKVEIWDKIVPKGGMLITFGDKELQSKEIQKMASVAFATNRVKIMESENKCHCWQFLSFLTEETQDEKEDSCFVLAGILSRMILYQSEKYRDPSLGHEPMNLLTIDDAHL
jgi:hypothetical protein